MLWLRQCAVISTSAERARRPPVELVSSGWSANLEHIVSSLLTIYWSLLASALVYCNDEQLWGGLHVTVIDVARRRHWPASSQCPVWSTGLMDWRRIQHTTRVNLSPRAEWQCHARPAAIMAFIHHLQLSLSLYLRSASLLSSCSLWTTHWRWRSFVNIFTTPVG